MKFVVMHKGDEAYEAGQPPSPEMIAKINQFIGTALQSGIMHGGEGLRPSAHRVRLNFSQGNCLITKGPYIGGNELPAVFTIIKVASQEEAIGWAKRFAVINSDEEIELGLLVEAWDLGMMPKPEGEVPLRYLISYKANARTESGEPPNQQLLSAHAKLKDEMSEAGVLVSHFGLLPSAQARRLNFSRGKQTIIDGPFTESKELIAGFSILELPSLEVATEWSARFAALIGDEASVEIDIRRLAEMPN
jgi:hypothetical protein